MDEEKKVETSKTLIKYLKQQSKMFTIGTVALLGNNIGELLIPLFIGEFIDLITNARFDEIWWLCGRLLIVVGVSLYSLIIYIVCKLLHFLRVDLV